MFTVDDLLSAENQSAAFDAFRAKRDGSGPDGLRISDFEEYWKANHQRIEQSIRNGIYSPGVAKLFEISGKTGKRRIIASINATDRFLERLLQQKFRQHVEPLFKPNSFAYQEGKGTLDAAMLARNFIADGCTWLCEVDIKDYFDSLNLDRAVDAIKKYVGDDCVFKLIESLLRREVEQDGHIRTIKRGLLQGS